MKKVLIAVLFSSIVLLSTELNQLLKLPFLIEHYLEHKNQTKDLTFFKFLVMHYFEHDVNVSDYERDMKLPFKSHDSFIGMVFHVFVHPNYSAFKFNYPIVLEDEHLLFNDNFFAKAFIAIIWQPPR